MQCPVANSSQHSWQLWMMPAAHGMPHASCWPPHGRAHASSCLPQTTFAESAGRVKILSTLVNIGAYPPDNGISQYLCDQISAPRTMSDNQALSYLVKLYWATAVSGISVSSKKFCQTGGPGAPTRVIDILCNCNPMQLQISCFASSTFFFYPPSDINMSFTFLLL